MNLVVRDLEERLGQLVRSGGAATDEAFEAVMELARDLQARIGENPVRVFYELEKRLGFELDTWLHQLAWDFGRNGRVDRAEAICRTYGELVDPVHFLGELGIILAKAERRDEALAQVESNLATRGSEVWTLLNAGETFEVLGQKARAEELYRRALSMAADPEDREAAEERLQTMLGDQRRGDEPAERLQRDATVGRNDPCPCASGRKFKKCCGKS